MIIRDPACFETVIQTHLDALSGAFGKVWEVLKNGIKYYMALVITLFIALILLVTKQPCLTLVTTLLTLVGLISLAADNLGRYAFKTFGPHFNPKKEIDIWRNLKYSPIFVRFYGNCSACLNPKCLW